MSIPVLLSEVEGLLWADLDEETQRKALDRYRDWNVDHDWWEWVYEDAVRLGALIGIHIDSEAHIGPSKKTYTKPNDRSNRRPQAVRC